jgi:polyisoprenoid-binding protein YceI
MIHPALLHVPTPNWAAMAWSLPYGWYEPPPPPDPSDLPPPGRYHLDPARSSVRAQIRGLRRWRAGTAGITGTLRFGRGSAAVELAVESAGLRSSDVNRNRVLHGLLDPPAFPLLRFTAGELAAAHGAWLVPGQVTLRGRAAPVAQPALRSHTAV